MAHRPAATRHRLVTAPGTAAERDIIHAALGGRTHAESPQNNINDSLRR